MLIRRGIGLSATATTILSVTARTELWLALVLISIPTVLACATVIILALSVERRKRVEAIKVLPGVLNALTCSSASQATTKKKVLSLT